MEEIFTQAPHHWKPINVPEVVIKSTNKEYKEISFAIFNDGYRLIKLIRQHQLHRYGLFILREKFLALYHSTQNYFRVRRYVAVPYSIVELALETNLDPRRCNHKFFFTSRIPTDLDPAYAVFIVSVVTWDLYADILIPSKSSDYFIEYIAYVKEVTSA